MFAHEIQRGIVYLGKGMITSQKRRINKCYITWKLHLEKIDDGSKIVVFTAEARVSNMRGAMIGSCGLSVVDMAAPFKGSRRAEDIAAVWSYWHDNHAMCACEHQIEMGWWAIDRMISFRANWHEACPVCGNVFSAVSAHKVRLPQYVIEEIMSWKHGIRPTPY